MSDFNLGRLLPQPLRVHVSSALLRASPRLFSSLCGTSRFRQQLNEVGIAFIHIPKTAGTSVAIWLYGRMLGHLTWDRLRAIDPTAFPQWHKFAVTREPAERFVSAWIFLAQGGNTPADRLFSDQLITPSGDIEGFVDRLADPTFCKRVLGYWHFRPQVSFVIDPHGRIMVDRLVPFERLPELPALLGIDRPLPTLNRTPRDEGKLFTLSPSALSTIASIYADDSYLHAVALTRTVSLFGRRLASTSIER